MNSVAVSAATRPRWLFEFPSPRAISAWALSASVVVYLGLAGGGYSLPVHSRVAIVVWWIVVVSAAWGLLPVSRPSRRGLIGLGLFAGFTAWTALGITWSISSGRSWQDLSLITCYLGILVLGLAIHRERDEAVRHTVAAVATGIVLLAALAVISRLWPHLIPSSQVIGRLSDDRARLAWPLNYWNGVAALIVLGIPLLLAEMTSARTLWAQAAAGAALPLVVLCGALTLSRGGVISCAVALVVFVALAHERLLKLTSGAFAAAGSAVLVAGAFHRHAIQQGLSNAAEQREVGGMVVAIILVCAGVALAQAGIGLLARHTAPPRALTPSPKRARVLLGVSVLVLVAVALAIHVPGKIDHLWTDFKNPKPTSVASGAAGHLSSTSGEGRYQYWQAGVNATSSRVLIGAGPGTYQLLWLPRAPFFSYVTNAHSLYVETYAELGVVGLILLVGFLVTALTAATAIVIQQTGAERTRGAAITAALAAFAVFAAFDWIWQLPVLPACFLLLSAAALAPSIKSHRKPHRGTGVALVAVGLAALIATSYPLATSDAVANSQTAFDAGNHFAALTDARDAVAIDPNDAAAQIQLALIFESYRDFPAAVSAARKAVSVEAQNWSNWLTLSRLEAEDGHARASLNAYRRARALNPRSPIFQ
jgi:O-Antigen ligase